MNSRYAQIMADATDPVSGRVDRQKMYEALCMDSSDPLAIIFDAAGYTAEAAGKFAKRLEEATTVVESWRNGLQTTAEQTVSTIDKQAKSLSVVVQRASQAVNAEKIADQVNSAVEMKLARLDVGMAERQVDRFVEKMKQANEGITWTPFLLPTGFSMIFCLLFWVFIWHYEQKQADVRIQKMATQVQEYPKISAALAQRGIMMELGKYQKDGRTGWNIAISRNRTEPAPFMAEDGSLAIPID